MLRFLISQTLYFISKLAEAFTLILKGKILGHLLGGIGCLFYSLEFSPVLRARAARTNSGAEDTAGD